MGSSTKKPRPMRSRKSGLKTKARIDKNIEVLKRLTNEKN
jgi:hypothetical protein